MGLLSLARWPNRLPQRPWVPQSLRIRRSRYINTAAQGGRSNLPQQLDLLERYRGLVSLGRLNYDENQVRVIIQLRRLQRDLQDYTPIGPSNLSHWNTSTSPTNLEADPWWSGNNSKEIEDTFSLSLFRGHADELHSLQSPKGLLLTGPPGSGKTFLVDLWFSSVPTPYKVRKHYNQLVLEIYRAVWEITQERMADLSDSPMPVWTSGSTWKKRSLALLGNIIPDLASNSKPKYSNLPMSYEVAKRLIHKHWLLVFDEVQLLDVSSANLLADVLSWFWRLGGVVVGTSNKIPEDLYKNGVQRERLEPFVEALKARCPVVNLESRDDVRRDWRVVRADGVRSSWFLAHLDERGFDAAIATLSEPADEVRNVSLTVFGRPLHVPWANRRSCWFSFEQLCAGELGSADYLTLASTFETLILDNVPILQLSAKDQARRFISLIDALYEARCRLIVRAHGLPQETFFPDTFAAQTNQLESDIMMSESVSEAEMGDVYRPNVSSYDAPSMARAPAGRSPSLDTLSIFSGKDEQFAFKRALSRLIEMTSSNYHQEEIWTPLPIASRKWETNSNAHYNIKERYHPRSTQSIKGSKSIPQYQYTNNDDFAIEAAFEPPHNQRLSRDATIPAPRLREHHVWGVRDDWGKAAGEWGKGARVYEDTNSESKQR